MQAFSILTVTAGNQFSWLYVCFRSKMDHTKQPLPDTPEDVQDDVPLRILSVKGRGAGPVKEDIKEEEEHESDLTDDITVQHLAEDVQVCYENKTPLYDTYFYKVVLGGNVDVVKKTVQYLEANCDVRVVSWLFDIGCSQHRKMYVPIQKDVKLKVVRWVVFIISAIISILFSPVFYCLHGLGYSLLEHRKRYLSNRIALPLAFAAFSHSVEMVQYFFQKNIRAVFTDNRHNNVFHYIADLAAESSSNALMAFDIVMEALEGEPDEYIKELLFENQNSQGFSALEYTARYGSPALLTKMMNFKSLMRHTQFRVQPKSVNFKPDPARTKDTKQEGENKLEVKVDATQNIHTSLLQDDKPNAVEKPSNQSVHSSSLSLSCWGEAKTRVDFIDVTKYESDHLTKRSLLLRLIGSRSISEITLKDLQLFQKCPVVGKWIRFKIREAKKYIYIFHTLDVIVTFALFVLLAFLKGSLPYQIQESQNFFQSHLGEVVARQENISNIITPDAMLFTLNRAIQNKQLDWSINILDDDVIDDIISKIPVQVPYGPPNMTEKNRGQWGHGIRKNKTLGYDLPSDTKEIIIDKAFSDMNHTEGQAVFQNLFELTIIFSKGVLVKYPDLPLMQITEKNAEWLEQQVSDFFQDFETEIQSLVVKPSKYFTDSEWRSLFCPSNENLTLSDFKREIVITPPPSEATDICRWQSLVTMAEINCKPDTPLAVYGMLEYLLELHIKNEKVAKVLVYVMIVFAVGYIIVDIFEHLRFFYICIQTNHSTKGMIRAVLTWRIPGSYYRKQLNIITYYVLILHVAVQADAVAMFFTNAYVAKLTYQMLLIGLCLRFIMHIHSLRLFPWIGHFVITTFRMATNLIHFSTVLGLVIFIFGVIFHILIVDEKCPIRKEKGFEGVGVAMFSVFKLTFGHGEFEPYYSSTPVMFTYALFTIIVGLLLLNLIIAIMSTTAMDLMTPDGREALGKLEWLNESLAAEYTVAAIAGSCYKALLYKDHSKAGYVVTRDTKEPKVYIRVFYCPKLD